MKDEWNRPTQDQLPKYIVMDAHDGEGNTRQVKYINEDVLTAFEIKVKAALDDMNVYSLMSEDGEEE